MSKAGTPTMKQSIAQLTKSAQKLGAFAGVSFFLLVAAVYGFVLLRINTLSNMPVDQTTVSEQVQASPVPGVDENAAAKLRSLRDNSVNVQTLFREGRDNPFAE